MKNLILFATSLFVMLLTVHATAQADKTLRPSPPAEVLGVIDSAKIIINYSSPAVKGRQIWDALVPYNQVWRTGANEATTFETNKDLTINGQKLPAGKYALFTVPGEKSWTIIFNSAWDQWGAFKYDADKDVLQVNATSEKSREFHERFLITIADKSVILSWEKLEVKFNVQ